MRPLSVGIMSASAVEPSSVGMMDTSAVAVTSTCFLEPYSLFIFLSIIKWFYEDTKNILEIGQTTNIKR